VYDKSSPTCKAWRCERSSPASFFATSKQRHVAMQVAMIVSALGDLDVRYTPQYMHRVLVLCSVVTCMWPVRFHSRATSTHLDRIAIPKTQDIVHQINIPARLRSPPWYLADPMHVPRYVNVIVRQTCFSARMAGRPSLAQSTGQPPAFDCHVNNSHE
jgi:hypothetical protein